MLKFVVSGSTNRTRKFLESLNRLDSRSILERLGQKGVDALAAATPVGTGETAASWSYEIEQTSTRTSIYWLNSHDNEGANVAVLLQYGHATGTGGYVQGQDYINPAIQPIFDEIADSVWKQVTNL